ncbi:RND transporter permease [Methylophaga sp. 42_25_T18]|nr:RND transporter permease [Methylophaga sp. 42_25_T18]
MNLTRAAINNRTVTYFTAFLVLIAGVAGFFSLGQLEDPDFTIKTAVISTQYLGADPTEVELEVTDKIELALQEMKQVKNLRSISKAGLSIIFVDIESSYTSTEIPQIWDELRRKIRNVESALPPGVDRPVISDDFGDVYGHLLAVTGDGFSYAEMESYAKELKKELSLVEGVARVDIWGAQKKVAYLDISQTQLSQLGITDSTIQATLQQQNLVVDAGRLDIQNKRLRIAPTGQFQSVQDIADLPINPSLTDSLSVNDIQGHRSEIIRIKDIGTVRLGYQEPAIKQMRVNGEAGITLAVTNVPGVNIVDMGKAVANRLRELNENLPIGIEVHRIHWQADVVDEAISNFLVSFLEAVAIVLVVLTIGMGWRLSVIIGIALVGTILGSFLLMAVLGIDLQRMSLGALIIALGMMVDNAIVVADGIAVRMQKGMDKVEAAIEAATLPSMPLLGATVVAVMAFYPIYSSTEDAGEYCATLFSVVAISLMVSWVISVTLTPLQCVDMLKIDSSDTQNADPYAGGFYSVFRGLLEKAIRLRWLTMAAMIFLLVVSVIGFGQVKQLFFPDSSMTKLMIDYWAPEGTRVQTVSDELKLLEDKLLNDDRVESVSSFIGAGPPRFYLPVESEQPNSSYAQVIVNVKDYREIDGIIAELNPWLSSTYPDVQAPIRKFGVGPSNTWKFEVRISGPNNADPDVLRTLAKNVISILDDEPLAGMYQTDWRDRVQTVVPEYSQEQGRWAGVWREDIANATKRAFDGRTVGLYREKDDLIPIVLRQIEEERKNIGSLDVLQIHPKGATYSVPLSQVTDGVYTQWVDPIVRRRDRRRTITVQANPIAGYSLPQLRVTVVDKVDAIELPPGYNLEWGGEYESSKDSQASLIPGVIPAVAIIALIIVALFNSLRPPTIIALTIPFAVIGITSGLLITGAPFGFVALLAAMSLAGMMIKNAIVLLDEVNLNLDKGREVYDAVIEAALSRVRPVVLAAATTVLGVIPLLQDVFWLGLAVVIMAGLTFGTVLTMIVVPVLYAILYKVKSPVKSA